MANPVHDKTLELTAEASKSVTFISDPTFWALVALAGFFGILIRMRIPARILGQLDKRAQEISDTLDEARDLREQAQRKLAEAERLQAQSEKDAEHVLEAASEQAAIITEKARQELDARLKRREEMAARRLTRIEEDAVRQIRHAAVSAAAKAAETVLRQQMDEPTAHNRHLQDTLKQVEKALCAK